MIVKVLPGHAVFREGYLRTADDGVFRLYDTPPDRPNDPHYDAAYRAYVHDLDESVPKECLPKVRKDGPTRMQKWLGRGIVEASDREKEAFRGSDADEAFSETLTARNPEAVMSRAGAIAMAIGALDHDDDGQWTEAGLPRVDAVEALSGLPNVLRNEIMAVAPEVRRAPTPKSARGK